MVHIEKVVASRQKYFNTNNNVDKHEECFYEDVMKFY